MNYNPCVPAPISRSAEKPSRIKSDANCSGRSRFKEPAVDPEVRGMIHDLLLFLAQRELRNRSHACS